MEHSEARELLELAAVEPDGFDRLAAGDTPEASALAGHLAGCPECSAELERLRRASAVIRDAVRTAAPPELRERTLAFVAAIGRDRSAPELAAATAGAGVAVAVHTEPEAAIDLNAARERKTAGIGRLGLWAASIAAGIVIALVAGQLLIVGPKDTRIAEQGQQVTSLAKAAAWSLAIGGSDDAERVALASTAGDDATGGLLYSPGSNQLVVIAQGLEQPPAGMEYRCWMESGGRRTRIGKMFFAGDVAYWVGEVPDIDALGEDATFGVSPAPISDPDDVSADPILGGAG
jgi:hypothetical protein